nr:Crp/Fnr family transcriptional regulator [uncultured Dyadobacter sp.]
MEIDGILDSLYQLPAKSRAALLGAISGVTYPKGHMLLRAGKVEPMLYFIKRGIVRAYADSECGDVTFWFGREGDTIISMKSYVAGEPGYEHVELLEDCDLYALRTETLRNLFANDIHIANLGRKLAEKELIKTEERIIAAQFRTAQERYVALMAATPDLLQRVQLCHIASYLGITQVTLSRIRAGIR